MASWLTSFSPALMTHDHDMGDFYTVKNDFDLTSGNVKNIGRESP